MVPWENSPRPPRAWQVEALPRVLEALWRGERPLVRAATGAGKAQLISEIAYLLRRPGEVVVVVAPRQSLVEQLSGLEGGADLRAGSIAWRVGVLGVGVYFGGAKIRPTAPIVVTCGPSLAALAGHLARRGLRCCALIVDEAHRSEAASLLSGVETLAPRYTLGVSATPWRTTPGESISLLDREVYSYGIGPAIRDGVLVPWDTHGWDGDPLTHVNDVTITLIREHAHGPGVVDAFSIDDAMAFATTLTDEGIAAAAIHSNLSRRTQRALVARLLSGELRCLVHVSLLAEGVDIPELRWIAMRRPTGSAIRFAQQLGRVLRTAPGKDRAVLIDPYDLSGTHGLSHDTAVGDALDDAVAVEVGEPGEETAIAEGQPCTCQRCAVVYFGSPVPPMLCSLCRMPPVACVSQITAWCRRAVLDLVGAGLASEPLRGGTWRTARPSERQIAALRRQPSAAVQAILPFAAELSRGEVSDLLGAAHAIASARRAGALPPLAPFPRSALVSLESRCR